MNGSDDLGVAKDPGPPPRTTGGHRDAMRSPGTRWQEVTMASFDVRAWRRQGMTPAKAERLLTNAGSFLAELAGGKGKKASIANEGGGLPPDCELVRVEYRECTDEHGDVRTCRCELYECSTGSIWQCVIVE